MAMRRSSIVFALVFVVALFALGLYLYQRSAPPQATRLLPEGDAVIYADLGLLRLSQIFSGAGAVVREPEYEKFVQETGFQFERDLDQAALAVHFPSRSGGNWETRFSEVFIGRFDGTRLAAYLRKLARTVERHDNTEVFIIPYEDRIVRVAILSADTVAVSNHENPRILEEMIARFRQGLLSYRGPTIIRENYQHVPLASVAWGIVKIPELPGFELWRGWAVEKLIPRSSVIVASARFTGSLQIKAEAFTGSEQRAKGLAENAGAFLQLYREIERDASRGPDPDVKTLFDSLQVEQEGERVVLRASIPQGFLRKAMSESPATPAAPSIPGLRQQRPATRRRQAAK